MKFKGKNYSERQQRGQTEDFLREYKIRKIKNNNKFIFNNLNQNSRVNLNFISFFKVEQLNIFVSWIWNSFFFN